MSLLTLNKRPHFYFTMRFLLLLFMFGLLTACGGGSDEPSMLVADTGGNVGGKNNPVPAPSANEGNVDVSVSLGAQQIVPSGGSTTIRLVTFKKFDPEDEDAEIVTQPNVTFQATVTGNAILQDVPKSSNSNGEAVFTITHPGSENVLVTVKGTGRYIGGFSFPIYFGSSVSAKVMTESTVPADGTTPATVTVFARDAGGVGISGIPVELSFSLNSFAVPTQASGSTGVNGEFTTGITNTIPQTVKVTPIAGGMATAPLTLTFDTTIVAVKPVSLDLIIKQDNVVTDGKTPATVVIIARDEAGTPIPNVPVSITSDSATAMMTIGGTSSTLFIKGNTGQQGSFELNLTNTVEESVTITATSTSGEEGAALTASQDVKFVTQTTETGVKVARIELDAPINNEQPANGEDIVTVRGRVLDEKNNPVAGKDVSIIVSGGSANVELVNNGTTDSSGRFFVSLTDEVVEEFTVKAVIGDVTSNLVSVRFVAIPAPVEETEVAPTPPKFITLLATPDKQIVDDGTGANVINLIVSVRDSGNTPMEGIKVRVSAASETAIFDTGQQETNAGGVANFSVSNSVPGSFTVTATAWVEDSQNRVVGTPIQATKSVLFYTSTIEVARLTVTVVNNRQPASGQDAVRIDVLARDGSGRAVSDAPIIVQMAASSAAIANPARGKTDENGFFTTDITSTVAGEVPISIAVEGTSISQSVTAIFIASTGGDAKPETVSIQALNAPQPADSTSKIILVVTPRDAKGTPLAGVDINLISSSQTAELADNGGTTNALGEFRTTVINSVAETFTITPVAADTVIGPPVSITFTPAGSGVTELLPNVVKNNQPATNKIEDAIEINVIARDKNGRAVSGVPIAVTLPPKSLAIAHVDNAVTDANGFFAVKLTSPVAGDVAVTIGIEGTSLIIPPVIVTFKPVVSSTPTTLEARLLNGPQPADAKSAILLLVTPKDAQGALLPGVEVELISDSTTAVIAENPITTNALGEARFSITNSVAQTVTLTPVAGTIKGPPVSLTFTPVGSNVKELIVTPVKNNQPATGDDADAILINVIARDENGPVEGVPIAVQLPANSRAVVNTDPGVTDKNGVLVIKITSTVAGDIPVVVSVKGTSIISAPVMVSFKAAVAVTPTRIEASAINPSQVADGQSEINVVVIPYDAQNSPIVGVDVELINTSKTAKIDNNPVTTNPLGEARFAITDTEAETVTLTPVADGVVGKPIVLTFVPIGNQVTRLVATVVNDKQPATGLDENAIQIDVIARDQNGKPIPEVPIVVLLPSDSKAVAKPFEGKTATDTGVFSTKITSAIAGEMVVSLGIKDSTTPPQQVVITFVAGESTVKLNAVAIEEVRNAPQPADGKSQITLVVVPRSEDGKPLPGVNLEFVSDPNQLVIEGGQTNALGQYQTVVVSDIAGTFQVTPIAWQDGEEAAKVIGQKVPITFTPIGIAVADLTVTVVDDKQPASGTDAIRIDVIARDKGGRPVVGAPIVVQLPTGTAAVAKSPDPAVTDQSGQFSTLITSTQPGEVAVTIAIGGTPMAHPPVIITFVGQTGATPAAVELLVLDAPKPADGTSAITLVVTPRDAKGVPLAGVDIELIHTSNTAKLGNESGSTNALGEFRTTVTDTVAETFNITPIASKGALIGTPVPVTFTPKAVPIPNSLVLTVEYGAGEDGHQVGQNATLTVFAYDDKHGPMNGVPVTLVTMPGEGTPDVSGTAKFDASAGAQGYTGKADGSSGNGTFTTSISNTKAGTFKVVAKVTGTSLSSNTVEVVFVTGKTSTPDVAEMSLITNYPQLGSNNKNADNTDGVIITAILKNKDNNLVEGAVVSFTADSGEIRATEIEGSDASAGTTDASGRAQALLTTLGNRNNRTITVTAKVSTATGEVKTATIPVRVVGTSIRLEGETTVIMGGSATLTAILTDSGKVGIPNEILKVESSLGNTVDNSAPVTNASGQATIKFTAVVAGQDVVTVSKDGATAGTLTINISDHDFNLLPVPETTDVMKILLNTPQEFVVRWKKGGVPQALQTISLSASRGQLPASVTTDINGEARFTITSDNAGPAQLKASATAGGPSRQIDINFIAARVAKMTLQAEPSTIGVNLPGASADVPRQQSQIIAVLRDPNNNLVEGKAVNFTLIDNTGGTLSVTSSLTDQFGQASTSYIAGASPTASEGVIIIATVEGQPSIDCAGGEARNNGCAVKLTVALKRVFLSLGTGNKIGTLDDATYSYPYKVLATDINGAPIPNTEVVLSVVATGYLKGYYQQIEGAEGDTGGWAPIVTAPPASSKDPYCFNEDQNRNGLLDTGEDRNQNGRLEPGGVVTFAPGAGSEVEGSTVKVKTGSNGYADLSILYAKEMANWVTVELTARSSVSGSEDKASVEVTLGGSADDFNDAKSSPPGRTFPSGFIGSPFGLGGVPQVDMTKTPPTVVIPNPSCDNDL